MSLTKRVGLVAGAAALTLTGGSFADNDSDVNQLRSDNAQMRRELDQLKAQVNGDEWLTEERADEIRSLVQDVLADADTRVSLMAQGMTAGYEDGAVIQSADGAWRLKTNLLMQNRVIYNKQDVGEDGDDDRVGFENTRTKFYLSGNVVSQDWIYMVTINVGSPSAAGDGIGNDDDIGGSDRRSDTGEAWIGHKFSDAMTLRVGSMKAPFLREDLVDAGNQLAVERSALNYQYTTGYTDGVALSYDGESFRATGSFNDGMRSGQIPWSPPDVDYSLTGRAEFLFSGTWEQFDDFTSPTGEETGIMAGGAIHYQDAEDDAPGVADVKLLGLTGDISLEFGGWNAYAALVYFDTETPGGADDQKPWGAILQGGVMLAENWELFARYEFSDYDDPSDEDLSLFTVGVNRYFGGNHAKWTLDLVYGINEVVSAPTITGLREDGLNEDGQFVLRSQLQIVF